MYIETMSKTLYTVFKSYYSQLSKCEAVLMTKHDVLVVEDTVAKSLFTQKLDPSKQSNKRSADIFALNGRESVLEQVIVLHKKHQ